MSNGMTRVRYEALLKRAYDTLLEAEIAADCLNLEADAIVMSDHKMDIHRLLELSVTRAHGKFSAHRP